MYILQWMDGAGVHEIESLDLNGLTTLAAALRHVGAAQHVGLFRRDEGDKVQRIG